MKKYNIHINNLSEAIKMVNMSRKYGLKSTITQGNYSVSSRNLMGMMIALPLDDATLTITNGDIPSEALAGSLIPKMA